MLRYLNNCTFLFCLLGLSASASANTGTFIDKQNTSDLRVVSYNVLSDSIFENQTSTDSFARVVTALQPDVLNLQEIYDYSDTDVANLMDTILPLPNNANWYAYDRFDNVIVSKYPIIQSGPIALGGASALIDLPNATYAKDLLVFNDHWRCCDNESARQNEADQTVRDLDNFRNGNGIYHIANETPFVVLGDLNIVSSGQPLDTVITGNIIDEFNYGPDSPPDWDGTSITDSNPVHNGTGSDDWTWRDDSSQFAPGTLDYILYSDSILTTANKYVLNTTIMTSSELSASGLQANDVVVDPMDGFFDHLPLVVDFLSSFTQLSLEGDYNDDGSVDAADFTVWRDTLGQVGTGLDADGDGSGGIGLGDYAVWVQNFGTSLSSSLVLSVPEPSAALILMIGCFTTCRLKRRSYSNR